MRVRVVVGGGGKLTMDWKPARRVRRRLVPSNEVDIVGGIPQLTGKQVTST